MTELLLMNEKKDIGSSMSSKSKIMFSNERPISIDFEDDPVYVAFKYKRVQSCYKKPLLRMLANIYKHHMTIIIYSFIIGLIFFGVPMIFIYINLFENIAFPLLIICLFGLVFSLLYTIIPCIDSQRYRYMLSKKPERKNIFRNIGNIFLFLVLLVSVFFSYIFYRDFLNDKDNKIKFDYNENYSYESEVLSTDFIFKYIIYLLLIDYEKIKDLKGQKIQMIFDDWDINRLRYDLIYMCIPLLVITFFTLIKIFIIEVRQTVEKVLFFGGVFTLLFFQCYINSKAIEHLKGKNLNIVSLFQNVLIVIILLGYILWNVNYTLVFIKKRKDNNFAIRKYENNFILIIIIIDVITCLGYGIVTLSFLYCFISFNFNKANHDNEDFQHLYTSLIILKIGFFPIIIGNSYYFGYYFLSTIFRPIAIDDIPYELKNKNYIKANRKLWNAMCLKQRRRQMSFKLKKAMQ